MKLRPVNIKRIEYLKSWICIRLVVEWRQELMGRIDIQIGREEGFQDVQDGEVEDDD